MMWHKLTLFGKILLFTAGFGLGMAVGFKYGKDQVPAQQTSIEIKDIKTKKGGSIEIDTKTKQDQEKTEDEKKKKKKGFLKRLFD